MVVRENKMLRLNSVPAAQAAAAFVLVVGVICWWLGSPGTTLAQEEAAAETLARETPLYEEEPYDRITLLKQYKNRVLKVEPLKLRGHRLPKYINPRSRLEVHLWDNPEKLYELRWSSIEKVELFEQMVLAKACRFVTSIRFAAFASSFRI